MNRRTYSFLTLAIFLCISIGGTMYYNHESTMSLEWQQLQDEYQNTPSELKVAMADVIRRKAASSPPQTIPAKTLAFIQTLPTSTKPSN